MLIFTIDEIIKKKKISILQLSKDTGISRTALYPMLSNEAKSVNIGYLNKIAKALNVSESELFKITNDTNYKLEANRIFDFKKINDKELNFGIACAVRTDNETIGYMSLKVIEQYTDTETADFNLYFRIPSNLDNSPISEKQYNNLLSEVTFNQLKFENTIQNMNFISLKKIAVPFLEMIIKSFSNTLELFGVYITENQKYTIHFSNRFYSVIEKNTNGEIKLIKLEKLETEENESIDL